MFEKIGEYTGKIWDVFTQPFRFLSGGNNISKIKLNKDYDSLRDSLISSIVDFNDVYLSFDDKLNSFFNQYFFMSGEKSSFGLAKVDEIKTTAISIKNKYNGSSDTSNLIILFGNVIKLKNSLKLKYSSNLNKDINLKRYLYDTKDLFSKSSYLLKNLNNYFKDLDNFIIKVNGLYSIMYDLNVPSIGRSEIIKPEYLKGNRLFRISLQYNLIFSKENIRSNFSLRTYFVNTTQFLINHKIEKYNLFVKYIRPKPMEKSMEMK